MRPGCTNFKVLKVVYSPAIAKKITAYPIFAKLCKGAILNGKEALVYLSWWIGTARINNGTIWWTVSKITSELQTRPVQSPSYPAKKNNNLTPPPRFRGFLSKIPCGLATHLVHCTDESDARDEKKDYAKSASRRDLAARWAAIAVTAHCSSVLYIQCLNLSLHVIAPAMLCR